jgi:hypothetical protein
MNRHGRGTHGSSRRARWRVGRTLSAWSVAAVIAAACYRRPPLGEPLPGATEIALPDSERVVLAAATQAIVDEGLSVQIVDDEHLWVSSRPVDIGMLNHLAMSTSTYAGNDRVVRFRFVVRRTFGASRLYGEVLYQPTPGGGERSERPVPKDNPARPVLARMIERIQSALAERRAAARPGG